MSQSFYHDLFDRKIDANDEWQYGMVETGGEGGINGGNSGDQDGSSHVSIYAAVDDLQTYLDKADRLGARVVMPVTDIVGKTVMAWSRRRNLAGPSIGDSGAQVGSEERSV
jgi:predicted enzyme related to lactoylglutathione lyase